MIDLFAVKRWRTYDFVQDDQPTSDGTWLCSATAGSFVRGYSYQVSGVTATRIEAVQDALIEARIHPTIDTALGFINNYFYIQRTLQDTTYSWKLDYDSFFPRELARQYNYFESDVSYYTFLDGVITGLQYDAFQVGDLVTIRGALRNNISGYVTQQSDGQITIDNPNAVNTSERGVIFLSDIPTAVEQIIAQMIEWDVFQREISDKKSESIGNYSYDNGDMSMGMLQYPPYFTTQLNVWRKAQIVT